MNQVFRQLSLFHLGFVFTVKSGTNRVFVVGELYRKILPLPPTWETNSNEEKCCLATSGEGNCVNLTIYKVNKCSRLAYSSSLPILIWHCPGSPFIKAFKQFISEQNLKPPISNFHSQVKVWAITILCQHCYISRRGKQANLSEARICVGKLYFLPFLLIF